MPKKPAPPSRLAYRRRYYARTANAEMHGKHWTDDERRQVWAHKVRDTVLAERLNRSVASIQAQRWLMRTGKRRRPK